MQIDQHILIRYFLKQASEEEKEAIRQWIESNEDNRRRFIRERIRFDASILVDEAAVEPSTKIASGKRYRLHPALNWSLKVAASVLLLLGSFYWYDNYRTAQLAQTFQCVYVPAGNRTNIQLPDGTNVWLNANTSLRYPMVFSKTRREIQLDGEGYFEVAKDAKKPFVVQAGEIDVEVLGTCFDLDSYFSGEFVETALLNGSVKISGKALKDPVYLKPNELFRYRKSDQIASVEEAKVGLYADWIKDRLVFDNDCLSDILISMEGRYNMDIECPKQFAASTRLSFTIRQESIEEVMEAMSQIVPVKYEIKGNKLYITPLE